MEEKELRLAWLPGDGDLRDAFAVRLRVFCDEQGYSPDMELDDRDKTARHLVACDGGTTVGTGRLYEKRPGVYGLGRLAILPAYRSCGLGARLVREMCREAARLGARTVELDAQCRVIPFYEKQGFTVCGEEHMDGHVPHRLMRRELPESKLDI